MTRARGAWEMVRWLVAEMHKRSAPRALPIGDSVVDGHGAGDGEDLFVDRLLLLRGVPMLSVRVAAASILGVVVYLPKGQPRPSAVTVVRDGELVPVPMTDYQIGKAMGITQREVRRHLRDVHDKVAENMRQRELALLSAIARGDA